MSIATMNWALQQRLASPQQQILLYVIADSADPTGVTQHCDPEYLVKHSRLSRATVFRRMNELRELGLLETFNKHGARGMRIYEIRLALAALVQVPLKGEQGEDIHETDDDDDGRESQAETQPQSQPETAVAPVRPAQSHSCDSISPPVSKETTPNPLPGGSRSVTLEGEAKELFEGFRVDYADPSRWSWVRVEPIFALLPIEDQRRIRAAAPVYAKQIAASRPKAAPVRPERFIRDRIFDNFPDARLPEKPPERVWIVQGSWEWRALETLAHLLDQAPPRPLRNEATGEFGMWRLGAVKPDMAALAQFDPATSMSWPVAVAETREFRAWRGRYHDWTGRWPEERIVMRAGYTTKEVNGKPMTFQNRVKGLLTPCRWPPKKDGTLYPDSPSDHGGEHDGAGEA